MLRELKDDMAWYSIMTNDAKLIEAGYIPVCIETPMFDVTIGLAGTPDLIFYHPELDTFLLTDLKVSTSVKPLRVNAHPSQKFIFVFGKKTKMSDTIYHRYGMQLNAYLHLLRHGHYVEEIRTWFRQPNPTDEQYKCYLLLVTVNDAEGTIDNIPYDISSTDFRVLLDAWLYAQSRPELTQRSMVSSDIHSSLQTLPADVQPTETLLGSVVSGYSSGARRLPDEKYLPPVKIQGFKCPWTATVTEVRCTCQLSTFDPKPLSRQNLLYACDHKSKFLLTVSGEHCDTCQEAAASGKIRQTLSPHLRKWCVMGFQAGLKVFQIEQVLLSKDYPMSIIIDPPPRPSCSWDPKFLHLLRFTPSTSALRSMEQSAKKQYRYDKDDQLSFDLKLQAYAKLGAIAGPIQLADCKCPQADSRRPVCVNNGCQSFRAMWMASWQVFITLLLIPLSSSSPLTHFKQY